MNIDTAFVATSGFTLRDGFSCGDYYESELKKTIIRKAQRVVMLIDRSKLNRTLPYTFARPANIDVLITDDVLPANYLSALQRAKTIVVWPES